MSIDLFCAMIRPSSTKERMEMKIFRILRCFSRIYKNCYKTRVWTDFGRVRVRTDIRQ